MSRPVSRSGSPAPGSPGPGSAGSAKPARPPGPWLGREVELAVGPVAHGGHCVARPVGDPGGRVVFVRHALPGERVLGLVTEDTGGSYCRADAIRVLAASPDRVPPPCAHAGPGRCGGCDFQHASGPAQRALKTAVLREALARLGGLPADVLASRSLAVEVEELPGGLLGWRTRARFAATQDGWLGLRRHRSHDVEPLDHCPLTTDEVRAAGVLGRRWPGAGTVEVVAAPSGLAVLETPRAAHARPRRTGPAVLVEHAAGRDWQVSATGFWQVHPAAADVLAGCVRSMLRPVPGERALDLYAGAGLFAGVLATAVGEAGRVLAVEADPVAVRDATANLARYPCASVRHARVTPRLLAGLAGQDGLDLRPDLVVLDPPRAGAGQQVMAAVCGLGARAVVYVACDPAALARDLRRAAEHGYQLAGLRAFDLFPMTHHLEAVALLER
ncbi:MAG TPA: class I SAM-dependent RNA methyltransferase [Mycobacteriales bacterium]|nr:class I SAM-dependent RNA methyltransferase [Mycobacteriales bacterium]